MFGTARSGGCVYRHALRRWVGFAAVVGTGVTCGFPTDRSDAVIVRIQSASGVVIRGEQMALVARAFRVSGADTAEIGNVSFAWSSDDASLATVQPSGGSAAAVTGVNSGMVDIAAWAVAFEHADAGRLQLRVSEPLEVDSVRPDTVRYGDTITVYGIGVDSIALALLENTTLLDYPIPFLLPTRTRDPDGHATATFWVPPPAVAGLMSYIGPGVFGSAPESTFVLAYDALEPNETAPWAIDLDAPPLVPVLPQLLFYNPALFFEPVERDKLGIEWYTFTLTSPRDLTLVLGGAAVRGTFSTFLTDVLTYNPVDSTHSIGPTSWTLGPSSHACRGYGFEPVQAPPESTIVALRAMPAGTYHSVTIYKQSGHYSLRVQEGYLVSNPLIPRDDHEEDDFCEASEAQTIVADVRAGPVPQSEWHGNLTIDNPHDVDWIRFHVTAGALGQSVTIKIAPTPGTTDANDLDLYLLTAPAAPTPPTEVRKSANTGSAESIVFTLSDGDYYAVVVDYLGRPVRYGICLGPTPAVPVPPACATVGATPLPPTGPATGHKTGAPSLLRFLASERQ